MKPAADSEDLWIERNSRAKLCDLSRGLRALVEHRPAYHLIGTPAMALPELRLQTILTELGKHGRVYVKELAETLHVSRETIRRDLKHLEHEGHLRCTYGGGVKQQTDGDQPVSDRMRVNAREKARIGAKAAEFVADGMKIFIDAGTTTLAFARHLAGRKRMTVYTNSLDVAQALGQQAVGDIFIIGGKLRPEYRALLGPTTIEAIGEHLFDMAFISVATVDYRHGFMDFGEEEAAIRRALVKQSKQIVMLADSSKFGREAPNRTLSARQITSLITNSPVDADFSAELEQAGVKIFYV
ncbi:Transcriptional regulator, DeoR family [Methylocella tundrae]|uniref:Transcriptional regulator, DeoR family n=1 Tax=Methylocella tundrae TaxID=227605 RepID=A0A8B6M0S6_METTU|nr:DeoR/GlpR family DNA-binding transcription regulator [Methylocella tundrae]VTZ20932.1 Transcriptional regulator, DeoR family [Methylocella tundrae]VTZ48651.1 Transcriptional regulator, DeoR family [Methylocella tundrae]